MIETMIEANMTNNKWAALKWDFSARFCFPARAGCRFVEQIT